MTLFRVHPCDSPDRCRTSPAAAADCYVHCWDESLSPLAHEPAAAMTLFEQARLAEDPRTPARLLREVYAIDVESHSAFLAANPSTPTDLLDRIRAVGSRDARFALLSNPSADMAEVRDALRAGSGPRAVAAATNPALTEEDFAHAVWRSADPVRHAALANAACPVDLLSLLAADDDTATRQSIALNPSAPDDVRRRLAEDPVPAVRAYAGGEGDAIDIITSIAREREPALRAAVLVNPMLPLSLLWEVLYANGVEVSETPLLAAEHRNATEDLIRDALRTASEWDIDDVTSDDQYDTIEEVEDALRERARVWLRRERGIAWDDVEGIDDMVEQELTL